MKFNQALGFISLENKVGEKGEYKDKPYFQLKLLDEEENQMVVLFIQGQKELCEKLAKLKKHEMYEFLLNIRKSKYGYDLTLDDVIV